MPCHGSFCAVYFKGSRSGSDVGICFQISQQGGLVTAAHRRIINQSITDGSVHEQINLPTQLGLACDTIGQLDLCRHSAELLAPGQLLIGNQNRSLHTSNVTLKVHKTTAPLNTTRTFFVPVIHTNTISRIELFSQVFTVVRGNVLEYIYLRSHLRVTNRGGSDVVRRSDSEPS